MSVERDPIAELKELVSQRSINVLLLGDWEFPGSADRRYICENIHRLADQFDTLALELNSNVTDALVRLNESESTGLEFGQQIRQHGYDTGTLYLMDTTGDVITYPPDPGYFGSLERARDAGMKLIAIDELLKDGAYTYRDDYMCKEILKLVRAGKRVIVLGGFRHHYKRSVAGPFTTISELLAEHQEVKSLSVLFGTGDLELLDLQSNDTLFWQEARCEHGSCRTIKHVGDSVDKIRCRYRWDEHNSHELFDVLYKYWDVLIRVPQNFGLADQS